MCVYTYIYIYIYIYVGSKNSFENTFIEIKLIKGKELQTS